MLKQETDETNPLPTARVRVTPEELAGAIAALEARRQGASGTIAIGDAINELSLDNTPEDVLREVERRRTQQAGSLRKKRGGWIGIAAAVIAIGFVGIANRAHIKAPSVTTSASPQPLSLDRVRNEQQVYIDTHGLKQIIEGALPAQVQTYPDSRGIRWGLIKHDGKIYVQAYTFQTSEKRIKNETLDLHNAEDADLTGRAKGYIVLSPGTLVPDVKITLPIQAFRYQDSQQSEDQAKITVSDVHTDNHLWDKFDHAETRR